MAKHLLHNQEPCREAEAAQEQGTEAEPHQASSCAVPCSARLSGAAHHIWPEVTQSLFEEGAMSPRDPSQPQPPPPPPTAPAHKSEGYTSPYGWCAEDEEGCEKR